MRPVSRLLFTMAVALGAAGVAALALALLPVIWFAAAVVVCIGLALAAAALVRRDRKLAERKAVADAQAARLVDLQRRVKAVKARERAVEKAQLAVIEDFRREYGL